MEKLVARAKISSQGFTLIEMVVVLLVVSVLSVVIGTVLLNGVRAYQGTSDALTVLSKLRYAVERIAREVRPIGFDSVTGSYSVTDMSPSRLAFSKFDNTQVVIEQVGTEVLMTYTPPGITSTLVDQVNQLNLGYLQMDGTVATTANALGYIQIDLSLANNGQTYDQSSLAALRIKP